MREPMWEAAGYAITIAGSICLWGSYALMGLIARRYGEVFQRTTWGSLLIFAPLGILVYTLLLMLAATPLLPDPRLAHWAQGIGYFSLIASGLLCLIGVGRFAAVFNQVTQSQPPEEEQQP